MLHYLELKTIEMLKWFKTCLMCMKIESPNVTDPVTFLIFVSIRKMFQICETLFPVLKF